MKTYEKFIVSNLFRRRKVLPIEVVNLGEVLRYFIDRYTDPDWSVIIDENKPEDKKNDNILHIYSWKLVLIVGSVPALAYIIIQQQNCL